MGTLFKSASQEAVRIAVSEFSIAESVNPKRHSEAILDPLTNSGDSSCIGSINPPVLASHLERFPDLEKHSKTSKIRKESQKTLPEVTARKNDTSPRKKSAKIKTAHGNETASKFQELANFKCETVDFFGSLNWYESNKGYYDKRLQLVLDDLERTEPSRSGSAKQYYNYLLLDSRVSGMKEWGGFIRAVFFVGKGKNQCVFDHCIKEAAKLWITGGEATNKKVSRILDIWRGEGAVIVLMTVDGLVEPEAQTREALVIEALGKQRLCNKSCGSFYGAAAVLKAREKHELGATLLVKARARFVEDGAYYVFAPARLEKELNSKDGVDRVFAPVTLEEQFENRNASVQTDKEFNGVVLTSLNTEHYLKAQKTKF